jgi:transcription initiation factor TFIIB
LVTKTLKLIKIKKMVKKNNINKCPDCGNEGLYHDVDNGEIICKKCGYILDDKNISLEKEWRDFSETESSEMKRVGAPSSYTKYDMGLGTNIGNEMDSFSMDKKQRYKLQRLKKWQKRLSTIMEKNLKIALGELRRLSSALNLSSSIEEEAAKIYTEAVQKNLVRGRSIESIVSGVVYAACRRQNIPRTLEEISEKSSGISKKEIGKNYRYVIRELKIKILPSNPIDYISRFSSDLNYSPETQSKAVEILNEALGLELTSGRGPIGIAAAALYIAGLLKGERKTQRDISEVSGVTEVTIRNRYKEIVAKLDLEEEIKKIKSKSTVEDETEENLD